MTVKKLKEELLLLGVSASEYSLNDGLLVDAINLYKNYDTWEVFYLDEKGNRDNERKFEQESDACEYILKLFEGAKGIENKFNLNT